VAEGSLELNTPDPVVVIQDLKGNMLDKLNLSVASQKYKLGNPQNIKNQLAHQNYTTVGSYVVVSPMGGQPQDKTTQGVAESEKKGLYYYVNKRKKAGTSRPASSPKAPTAQAWKDAAKTAKKEDMDEAGMDIDDRAHRRLKGVVRAVDKLSGTNEATGGATETQVYQYMIRQAPEFMKTAITADVKRAIAKAMSYGSQISVPDLASYAYGILKTNDLDEGAAQQAAIAINMKKHHKKPKNEDVYTEEELNLLFDSLEEMFDELGIHEDNYDAFTDENILSEAAAWQKKSGKNKNGGLNKKGVASYRREHPGSHLQTAVTTKPSKLKKGSKASKRRKSFCARMKGMKKHRAGAKTKRDPNSRINKSLRKWNC
jgi:hypothetical protein